jgi:putative hydrolase of the HAD superfamily
MPIKAIIFDWGDVYLDWKHSFWETIAERLDLETELLEKEIQKYWDLLDTGTIQDAEFWKKVGIGLKVSIPRESEKWIEERFDKDFSVNKDVESVTKKLKNYGYKTALLSNTEKASLDYGKRHGWTKYFDILIASCDVGVMKPDQRIFKKALHEIRERPEDCIFIDDNEMHLEVARGIGMKTILFDNRKQKIEYLKQKLVELGVIQKTL